MPRYVLIVFFFIVVNWWSMCITPFWTKFNFHIDSYFFLFVICNIITVILLFHIDYFYTIFSNCLINYFGFSPCWHIRVLLTFVCDSIFYNFINIISFNEQWMLVGEENFICFKLFSVVELMKVQIIDRKT